MKVRSLFSPFASFDNRKFNNANRLARVLYRFRLYSKIFLASRGKVAVAGLVRKQFPFLLPDASAPPALSVELTNYCNLACPYCSSPLKLRPQGMMDPVTFSNLLSQVKECRIPWIALVGNGEPTLHPKFATYVRQLASVTKFLSVTTNWHRINEEIASSVLQAPVNLINISVDGGNKDEYESQRIGGNFERLLQNLTLLNRLKKATRSSTLINIRLMLRPPQREHEQKLLHFWRPYGDVVSKQYVLNFDTGPSGSYGYDTVHDNSRARCTLPFKILDVNWNGNVPLCTYSRRQTGNPDGLLIGNINKNSLLEIWNGQAIRQYRDGHRHRKEELIPICQGCKGRT
jgi:MoaA/NifB/PqqE/SkfB family radical SAM enzyme